MRRVLHEQSVFPYVGVLVPIIFAPNTSIVYNQGWSVSRPALCEKGYLEKRKLSHVGDSKGGKGVER